MKSLTFYLILGLFFISTFTIWTYLQPTEEEILIESCEALNESINELTIEQLYFFLSQGDNAVQMDRAIQDCEAVDVQIEYNYEDK